MPPDEATRVAGVFGKIAEARKPFAGLENNNIHKDGYVVVLETSGVPIFDADGEFLGYRGIDRDITERKRTEEALRESEVRFRSITSTAKDAIIMLDNNGNITYWNPAAEEIFGYTSQEAIGRELHQFLAPQKYYEDYQKGLKTFQKTGKGSAVGKTSELEAVRKDGTQFPMELSLSAIQVKGKWRSIPGKKRQRRSVC